MQVLPGSQTHTDQEMKETLADLENAAFLLEDKVQNLQLQIHLKCDWSSLFVLCHTS